MNAVEVTHNFLVWVLSFSVIVLAILIIILFFYAGRISERLEAHLRSTSHRAAEEGKQ